MEGDSRAGVFRDIHGLLCQLQTNITSICEGIKHGYGFPEQNLAGSTRYSIIPGATYRVQVSTSSGFAKFVVNQSGISDTSLALRGLTAGQRYYWRVRAANTAGTGPFSATWSFTTTSVTPPTAPTLVAPTDGSSGVSVDPDLKWRSVRGASSYQLQVSTNRNFASPLLDLGLSDTSQTMAGLIPNQRYYWRVNAANSAGTSPWSAIWGFTTLLRGSGKAAGLLQQPTSTALFQNYPNPFNPATTVAYILAEESEVWLAIYDLAGQRMRTLVQQRQLPGQYGVVWDGRNEAGQDVASGVYLYQLEVLGRGVVGTGRMLLVR